ncbi:MAG TPA: MFS transporter [Solirubrobacteraceae bacterium]|nr:MFS transporter [Solirubrobacteraceae bacterium]
MPAWLLLVAAGLALADASIVTLGLPSVIAELDASVEEAAAVLGSYTLVLAVALAFAAHVRASPRALAAGGSLVIAAASLACGIAGSLGLLLAARSLQAAGAAALLVGAFALVDGGGAGRRAWTAAAIFGFAAGPVLGGVLTQAIDWRAIFLAQVPVAIAAAVAAWRSRAVIREPAPTPAASWPAGPAVALALLSAALVGVLFLLVLMLVTGWSVSPLAAAAAVSVLPLAALAASRVRGPARVRASAGAVLVGGGVLALASLPNASPWWTVVPQLMAGAGMGLALPALAGELLPERTPSQAARLLSLRHAGITVALALLAPVAAAQLDDAVADTREQGAALVLDARLPPLDKLSLAAALVGDLDPVDPRGELQRSLAGARAGVDGDDRAAYAALAERADDALVAGVQDAFEPALAICGALALLAAAAAFPRERRGPVAAAAVAALALAGGARLAQPALTPEPIRIADPCQPRALPGSGGLEGALQDTALIALDRAACRFGSSREELALALVDDAARDDFEREYGVDPRSAGGLLGAILGL